MYHLYLHFTTQTIINSREIKQVVASNDLIGINSEQVADLYSDKEKKNHSIHFLVSILYSHVKMCHNLSN